MPDNDPCKDCDLETIIVLLDVDVSPDGIEERKRRERNSVEDGFRYALDKNGNVMKDTSGNDIKNSTVYKEVWADVFETRQFKAARLEGMMEVRDLRSERLRRIPVAAETQFRAESVWFQGDKRALDPQTVKQLKPSRTVSKRTEYPETSRPVPAGGGSAGQGKQKALPLLNGNSSS